MKVFMVTSGEYSDYRVEGVYSSMEKAEVAKKLYAADDIKEFEVDALPEHPPGMFRWYVEMTVDGDNARAGLWSATDDLRDNHPPCEYHPNEYHFYLWARDEEHAIKIANERRTQYIALNPGKVTG